MKKKKIIIIVSLVVTALLIFYINNKNSLTGTYHNTKVILSSTYRGDLRGPEKASDASLVITKKGSEYNVKMKHGVSTYNGKLIKNTYDNDGEYAILWDKEFYFLEASSDVFTFSKVYILGSGELKVVSYASYPLSNGYEDFMTYSLYFKK